MDDERSIMQQLDHLEQEVSLLTDSARSLRELRDELSPRVNETVKVLIKELAEVESDFQLEDLGYLLKNFLRSVRNLDWSLDQLKNVIDFLRTVEPLLKSFVPQAIHYLDQMERQGIFQTLTIMLGVMQKTAQTYTPEDFEQIGDGLVHLVGVLKKITSPNALSFLEKAAEVPGRIDLSKSKPAGLFRMLFALGNPEVKEGLGVLLEMTKGLAPPRDGSGMETGPEQLREGPEVSPRPPEKDKGE